jgi:peptidyl-prolyl cis-trans isomerase C/foldase protein PrsA
MKKVLIFIFVLVLSTVAFAAANNNVLATVNGVSITATMLQKETQLTNLLQQISSMKPEFYQALTTTKEGISLIDKYRKMVLQELIQNEVVVQKAKELGVNVSDQEAMQQIDSYLANVLKSYKINESYLEKFLQSQGYKNLADYKEKNLKNMKEKLMVQKLMDKITSNATITESEALNYYNTNKDKFKTNESIELSMYAFSSEATANLVEKDLNSGMSEAAIEKKYGIKLQKLGTLPKGQMADFDDLFNLPVGKFSSVKEINKKYLILKVDAKHPAGISPFKNVESYIKQTLISQKKMTLWQEKVNEWVKDAKIVNFFDKQ